MADELSFPFGFDPYLPIRQGAFQGFPGERLGQQPVGIQQKVAAVRPLQRAAAKHAEIRDWGPILEPVF